MSLPPDFQRLLATSFLGNTLHAWLLAFLLFCCIVFVLRLYANLAYRSLQRVASRTKSAVDDVFVDVLCRMRLTTHVAVALFVASRYLTLQPMTAAVVNGIFGIVVVYWGIQLSQRLVLRVMERLWLRRGESIEQMPLTFPLLVKFVLWCMGVLLILSNVGINVTSLLAGMGIGGVAIALAVQNILGDLLSSFSIYFDKPFRAGDYIVIGAHSGTVKSVGWKTTRLQALQGEEIIVSNQELTTVRVQNFKRMKQRRVEFFLRADLSTPSATARRLSAILGGIVASVDKDKVTLERASLKEVGETALLYQVSYRILSEEYAVYAAIQQEINFQVLEAFEKEGVKWGVPARRVTVEKN